MNIVRLITLLLGLIFAGIGSASDDKSHLPIRFIISDWTSQIVLSHIAAQILQTQGYQTEYVTMTTSEQWGALQRGLAHIQMEVWEGTMADDFTPLVHKGTILDAGTYQAKTREDWWYPDYVEKLCPDLPDWQALNRCAYLFRVDDSQEKGTYFTGPWETKENLRIKALKMDFVSKQLAHSEDLWKLLDDAIAAQRPIVLFNWTPNWVEAKYAGKFVEFPTYAHACESLLEWGDNPNLPFDCGNTQSGWLKKAVWSGLPRTWKCAYQIITNIDFNNSDIAQLTLQVDRLGHTYDQAASEWLAANKDQWLAWLPTECKH